VHSAGRVEAGAHMDHPEEDEGSGAAPRLLVRPVSGKLLLRGGLGLGRFILPDSHPRFAIGRGFVFLREA